MDFPVLSRASVYLTELQDTDKFSVYEIFSSDAVTQYYDIGPFVHVKQAEELIALFQNRFQQQQGIRWAIRLSAQGACIGTCGFNAWSKNMRSASIGYELHEHYWRKGIATTAIKLIIEEAFSGRLVCGRIHRIQADTVPENLASEQLLHKLGFVKEGLRRHAGYWKNQFHDLNCYGLLENEYAA